MTAGWGVAGATSRPALVALYGLLGVLPDADLLVGLHSRQTHSLGAAAMVAGFAALAPEQWRVALGAGRRWRFALGCGAAWASHVLLDWLGSDTTAPIGIMALWPWSSGFYQSDLHWFAAISRRYWQPEFVRMNALAAVREIVILGPVAFIVWRVRGGGTSGH
jgi:inner membrane protein